MGGDRAVAVGGQDWWAAGETLPTSNRGRGPVRGPYRLRMAAATRGFPAVADGVLVLSSAGNRPRRPRRFWRWCVPQLRLQESRNAEPRAGLTNSQSVKGADTVGRDTHGYGAGKDQRPSPPDQFLSAHPPLISHIDVHGRQRARYARKIEVFPSQWLVAYLPGRPPVAERVHRLPTAAWAP